MMENDIIIDLDNSNYNVPPLRIHGDLIKMGKTTENGHGRRESISKRPRRFSVSAEESNQHSHTVKDVVRKIYPKKPEAIERIRNSVSELFIWKGLDKEQQNALIDAMFEKKLQKGEEVVRQGDKGDYFYVIESGKFEVWKSPDSKQQLRAKKVFEYDGKGSFGELALLYNAPRAATVRAVSPGLLWAVDGETFRYIMISSRAKKRTRFDEFLKTVDLFRNINDDIRSEIADILEVFQFEKGEYVISQGDEKAEYFYIIQNGSVEVTLNIPHLQDTTLHSKSIFSTHFNPFDLTKPITQTLEREREKYVKTLREGSYFGERALLLNCERSANVIVSSQVLRCLAMDKASFLRLIEKTSVYDKVRRNLAQYSFSEKLSRYSHALSAEDESVEDDINGDNDR